MRGRGGLGAGGAGLLGIGKREGGVLRGVDILALFTAAERLLRECFLGLRSRVNSIVGTG